MQLFNVGFVIFPDLTQLDFLQRDQSGDRGRSGSRARRPAVRRDYESLIGCCAFDPSTVKRQTYWQPKALLPFTSHARLNMELARRRIERDAGAAYDVG
jgi:hypothetical protein